ncbi:hypothetical protein [Horticoccus sp. 23ND18S-11]|uniref:hypothetical protein n=1 Tax=Horticoccus sp. 23ND18S-11 TaxID=3391832 RepID=UPI0039C955E7
MYPNEELTRLAERKVRLRVEIDLHRRQCALAAAELAAPLAAVDRGIATWRRISPWVKLLALPGGLLVGRLFKGRSGLGRSRGGWLGTAMAAIPLVMRGAKMAMNLKAAFAAAEARPRGAPPPVSPSRR